MSSLADFTSKLPQHTREQHVQLRHRQQGLQRLRQPVAIIGPGDASEQECAAAYGIAACLGEAGIHLICGGRGGVMQAAAQGASAVDGIVVGVLPEEDTRAANPYLTVALPTGMGEMRNALIARSAICLIAVGTNLGTLSEMAMGLKWGKPLLTLGPPPGLPGAQHFDNPESLLKAAIPWLLTASEVSAA